jgi:hypothetical protein
MSEKKSTRGQEKESLPKEKHSAEMEEEGWKGRKRRTLSSKEMKTMKKVKIGRDSGDFEEEVRNRKGIKSGKKKTSKSVKMKKKDCLIDSDTSWSASDEEENGAVPKLRPSKRKIQETKIGIEEGKAGMDDSLDNGSRSKECCRSITSIMWAYGQEE